MQMNKQTGIQNSILHLSQVSPPHQAPQLVPSHPAEERASWNSGPTQARHHFHALYVQ